MKRKLIIIFVILITLCPVLAACSESGNTQEPPVEDYAESEWSKYFFENWLDKLVTLFSVVVGVVTAVSVTISKGMALMRQCKSGLNAVETKYNELEGAKNSLAISCEACLSAVTELKGSARDNRLLAEGCKNMESKTLDYFNCVKKILLLGFLNNGELVKKGYAAEIARIAGSFAEKVQTQTAENSSVCIATEPIQPKNEGKSEVPVSPENIGGNGENNS